MSWDEEMWLLKDGTSWDGYELTCNDMKQHDEMIWKDKEMSWVKMSWGDEIR